MKKILKVFGFVAILILVIIGIAFASMTKKTEDALKKQVNVEIDMAKVQDGTYNGESDGGMVKVEVAVEVENHQIKNIELIKHDNGKGKPAEAMLDDMILNNTDNVDNVSGATTSSRTIRNAVNRALQKGME